MKLAVYYEEVSERRKEVLMRLKRLCDENPSGCRVCDLHRGIYPAPTNTQMDLRALEQRGYVRRIPRGPGVPRGDRFVVTADGKRLAEQLIYRVDTCGAGNKS